MRSIRRAVTILLSAALIFAAGMLASSLRAQQPPAFNAPANPTPFYVITFVDITPDNKNTGVALLKQYVADTSKAPGIQRVEALSQINRTNHFVLYEIWQNEEAFQKHEGAQITRDFRTKMAPLLGAPFDQRTHFKLEK
jgi:quinol monooxygenase YgiN